jgi:hypothetical protein
MATAYEEHHATCSLSHRFINSLTVIVGSCDILREKAEHSEEADPQCLRRLALIREVAMELVSEVKGHACQLDALAEGSTAVQESHAGRQTDRP